MNKLFSLFKRTGASQNPSQAFDIFSWLYEKNQRVAAETGTQVYLSRKGATYLGDFSLTAEKLENTSPETVLRKYVPGGSYFSDSNILGGKVVQLDLRHTQQLIENFRLPKAPTRVYAGVVLAHELGHAQQANIVPLDKLLSKTHKSKAKTAGFKYGIEVDAWNRAEQIIDKAEITQHPVWSEFKKVGLGSYKPIRFNTLNYLKETSGWDPSAKEKVVKLEQEIVDFNKGQKIAERYFRILQAQGKSPTNPISGTTINSLGVVSAAEDIIKRNDRVSKMPPERVKALNIGETFYRGVPHDGSDVIKPGDLVTSNREEAKRYLAHRIPTKTVNVAGKEVTVIDKEAYEALKLEYPEHMRSSLNDFGPGHVLPENPLKPGKILEAKIPHEDLLYSTGGHEFLYSPQVRAETKEIVQDIATAGTKAEVNAIQSAGKSALSELSHSKAALGAGAVGIFAVLAMMRKHRRNEISPRRRDARVQEHPNFDTDGSTIKGITMLGALAAGMGIISKKGSPAVRASLAIGGAAVAGLGLSIKGRQDPSVAVLGMASAGAAAALAYTLVGKQSPYGIKSLRDFLTKHGAKATIEGATTAIENTTSKFPGIGNLISKETAATAAGLITLPMAHSLMVKHFAAEKRLTTDHGDTSFMAAWQDHKAGSQAMKKSNAPLLDYNRANVADVNFSGQVNSYYNSAGVFQGV